MPTGTTHSRRARGADFSSAQTLAEVVEVAKIIDFAFVKASQGVDYVNELLFHQILELRRRGVRVGFYHFLEPEVDGASQWDFFEQTIRQFPGTAVALDYEAAGTTDEQARAFIRRGRQRGFRVGLYGGWEVTKRRLGQDWRWTAYWSQKPPPARFDVWQFTDGGGRQDYDVFKHGLVELHLWWVKQSRRRAPRERWWLRDEARAVAIGPLRTATVGLRFVAYSLRHPRSRRYLLERK